MNLYKSALSACVVRDLPDVREYVFKPAKQSEAGNQNNDNNPRQQSKTVHHTATTVTRPSPQTSPIRTRTTVATSTCTDQALFGEILDFVNIPGFCTQDVVVGSSGTEIAYNLNRPSLCETGGTSSSTS